MGVGLGRLFFNRSEHSDWGYLKQSQFAMGVLAGYNLDPAALRTYLTRDVYQKTMAGVTLACGRRSLSKFGSFHVRGCFGDANAE